MADDDDQTEENEAPENEEGEEGEEGEEAGKKGGKKKLLILILLPLLLIGGGGGAAYYLGYLDSLLGIKAECAEAELDEHGEPIVEHDEHGDPIESDCAHGEEGEEHAEGDDHGEKKGDKSKKKDDGHGGEGGGDSAFLAVAPMVVNLNTEDGTPRLLRLKIQLELADPSEAAEVKAIMPRIENDLQVYLRGLRVRDIKGSAGIYRMHIEILSRVTKAAAPIEIKDVLFQEILVQ